MGGSESSHGGRKVSFGLDEREQVRVLQGIRLSEDVVNRMKESPQSKRDNQRSPCSSNGTASPSPAAEGKPKSPTGIQPPMASDSGQKSSAAEQELYRRYEREQALVQEELLRLAKREREAASEALNTALQRERNNTNEERQKAAQLPADLDAWAVELQGREAELKQQEAFYKEQLARIEKKNAEIYKLTSEQYQEAATKAEEWINLFLDLLLQMCDQLLGTHVAMIYPCDFVKEEIGTLDYVLYLLLQTLCTNGQVFHGLFPLLSNHQVLQDLRILYKLSTSDPSQHVCEVDRRRNTDPVCASLQSEILKCYQENKHEVLKCSELAKEYQRCVSAAQKELLVNSG